jgi:transglutaminase-like putative cysteine protease
VLHGIGRVVVGQPAVLDQEVGRDRETARRGEDAAMKIRTGYAITFDSPAPTPMLLMLGIHPSRLGDWSSASPLSWTRKSAETVRRPGGARMRVQVLP